ncbi:hypothetical protein KY284_026842 [Solanum tuberosum]|nr:hypothetical protein KY284_026842 [Solanum tuberosum]
MVEYIVENINPMMKGVDKAWWMGNSHGEFTVKSTFQVLRRKREEQEWMNYIWIKGLPFKISFFLWRVWRKRIPTDDVLKKMKVNMVSKCYCCDVGEEETIHHLFLTAPIAQQLWNHFASCAGINIEGLHLQQLITTWWEWPAKHKLKQILNAMPAIIMWELWKRRNARKHGRDVSYMQMHSQCQQTVQMLLKVRYPWIKRGDQNWKELITSLDKYKPTLHYKLVYWEPPKTDWVTCNTDGACRGNPGQSSYGFSIRDKNGDLIYAEAQRIGEATNMDAEIMGVWKALRYCEIKNIQNIILEIDSLVLKNMITNQWRIPWAYAEKIEDIQRSITSRQVHVKHMFREANNLADYLANAALDQTETVQAHGFYDLSSKGRRIINTEKHKIPSLRIKTRRIGPTC